MLKLIRYAVLSCVAWLPLTMVAAAPAADNYWRNHWGWYNNTYAPYYNRYGYGYAPGYYNGWGNGFYGNGFYGNGFYGNGMYGNAYSPYGYGYGYSPYQSYYGTPGFGVGRTWGGGTALNLGGVGIGWR